MRLSPRSVLLLKVVFHFIGLVPIAYLLLLVLNDQAGGDPVQFIIHYTGMGTINAVVATLLISPLAKQLKLAALMQTRRLVGLYAFVYGLLHIAAFVSFDLLFAWSFLLEEIIKRPYIMVGTAGFVILLLLAVTSPKFMMRKLGRRWQKLHNAIYLLAILAPVHFYWSVKSEIIEPSIYIGVFIFLLGYRAVTRGWFAKKPSSKAVSTTSVSHSPNHASRSAGTSSR